VKGSIYVALLLDSSAFIITGRAKNVRYTHRPAVRQNRAASTITIRYDPPERLRSPGAK
jgi:hypothetical protein